MLYSGSSHCLQCQYPIWVLVQDLVTPLSIRLLANGSEKVLEDGPSARVPTTYMEVHKEVPGFSQVQLWQLETIRE